MTNEEKAKILRKVAKALERLKEFVQQKSESACQARREAFIFLLQYLWLLNETRGKYGIHGPLEEPLRQLEYLADKSETKDLGAYVTLDLDLTQPKLSDGKRASFIDQLNLWANKCEKDKTEQDITPSKRRGALTCIKKMPKWIYILVLFLAALFTIFHYLGLLDRFKSIFEKILSAE